MRVLDAWRRAEKALSGRADMAMLPALTDMRGPARPAGAPRVRRRGRARPAAPLPDATSPPWNSAASGSPTRSHATGSCMDQIADLQEAYLHQVDGAARRPPARRAPAAGALDARGVPRLAVGAAARHGVPRQRPAHPQGASAARSVTRVGRPPPADDARGRLLRGAHRRRRPCCGQRGRRPRGHAAGARRARRPATPRSPTGCCTSPTPRASRRSPRSGRARRPTRSPAACGGCTCCAPGCTPTRSSVAREFEAGQRPAPGRPGRGRRRRPARSRRAQGDGRRGAARDRRQRLRRRTVPGGGVRPGRRHRPGGAARRRTDDEVHADAGAGRAARGRRPPGARRTGSPELVCTDAGDCLGCAAAP